MRGKSANFVLVKVAVGEETSTFEELSEIPGIESIHMVYGEYDMVIVIKEKDTTKLREIIMKQIRGTKGVIDTTTLVGAE
jgi:DNA-binding Lrp family transcriptional regulator